MNNLFLSSFLDTLSFIGYIMLAVLVLLIMITVHEFGHYIVGKIFKFSISEFSIGFGPKIFQKKKKNGELFSVRLLPFGGYCSFLGEDEDVTDPNAFNNKKPWQRILVLISGALMNFLLSILIVGIMFGVYGFSAVIAYDSPNTTESSVNQGLNKYDVILSCEGKNVYVLTDLMSASSGKTKGDTVSLEIIRDDKIINTDFVLLADTNYKNVEDLQTLTSAFGINENGFAVTGVKNGGLKTFLRTFDYSFKTIGTIFRVFGQLITGVLGVRSLGGTVTTLSVTANAVKAGGLWSLLNISSFIGINLAVFNLLPIPALDGSRVVFTLIEWIRKKPLNRRAEGIIHTIGFVFILLFAVFIDLQRCF